MINLKMSSGGDLGPVGYCDSCVRVEEPVAARQFPRRKREREKKKNVCINSTVVRDKLIQRGWPSTARLVQQAGLGFVCLFV